MLVCLQLSRLVSLFVIYALTLNFLVIRHTMPFEVLLNSLSFRTLKPLVRCSHDY